MAPINYEYGTIILLDVGKTTVGDSKDQQTFFSQAHQCAARIIERNIMIQSKNLVGVILFGSKMTNNELASECPGAFKYINVTSGLQPPTWQMIKDLPNESSEKKGDWFEALIVAAHHYKNGISNCKIASKKIVLITNFEGSARIGSNFDEVVNGFKDENFELYVIGPDLQAMADKNVEHITRFLEETDGDNATFEEAMSGWLFHKKKASKLVPQNFDLNIGQDIRIPISMYIRVKDEAIVKNWQKAIKDPVTLTASTTEGVKTERKIINTENQAMDVSETVEGYIYGQKIIPFSENDKNMIYQSGERSIMVYGFTKSENIEWQVLHGDCTYYVFGKKGDKNANFVIKCLVHCLHELNLVGIVRKVHAKNYEPKMFALSPVIDNKGYVCLSLIGICYKEEVKSMAFPSVDLKKFKTTDEQVNAFKDLIKAMDLTNAYDDTFNDPEAFPIAETVSPSIQYVLDCISFRAMNPGKPLPQPRDEIMTLFKIPPLIEKRSRDPIDKLKQLFTLKKNEKKTTRRNNKTTPKDDLQDVTTNDYNVIDIPKIDLPKMEISAIENIGTVDPTKDFKFLLNQGKKLTDLSKEMTEVIENLVYTNSDNTKILDTIKSFRIECLKSNPGIYNIWLKKFKRNLLDRKRDAMLNLINDNNVNFILKSENELSDFTEENCGEDSQIYEADTIPNTVELSIRSDVNDLFDDM